MEKELAPVSASVFLDGLHEGVGLIQNDGRVLYLNEAARRYLALDKEIDYLSEIDSEVVADSTWQSLLVEAPTKATAGSLLLESRAQQFQGQPLIQLLVNEANRGAVAEEQAEEQLTALARISRELNATLFLENILKLVMDEALRNTLATSGLIVLQDAEGGEQSRLQEGEIVETPAADAEVRREQRSVNIPELEGDGPLRSALLTPIIFEGQVAGLIHLFSESPRYFRRQTEIFVNALANHAAIAIGNARRFSELRERNTLLQQRTQQIEHFVESSRVFHSDRPLAEVYEDLVYAIQEGVGYNAVLLSLAEKVNNNWILRRVTAAGLPLDRLKEIRQTHQPWTAIEQLLRPEFSLGGAYLVPASQAVEINPELTVHQVDDLFSLPIRPEDATEDESWQENDLFFIPMRDSQGHPLGLISLAAPIDGRRPDLNTARVLEIFANQAANAIENVQLFHDMRDYAIELQQLHNVSQQTLREEDFGLQLQLIADGLQTAGWGRVSVTLRDEEYRPLLLVTGGLSPQEHEYYKENMLPAAEWRRRFADAGFARFRRGSCYYIPHDAEEIAKTGAYGLTGGAFAPDQDGAWHPNDILIRPLYDREGKPVGLIGLDEPLDGRQPSERDLQTIDLYAQFAISVIENHRLFAETDRRHQELQTLFETGRELSGTLDQEKILKVIGEHMLQAVNAEAYTIYALEREQEQVTVLQNSSHAETVQLAGQGVDYDLARLQLAQEVVETSKPVSRLSRGEMNTPAQQISQAYTITILPLMIRDEMFGLVEVIRLEADPVDGSGGLSDDQLQLLGAIINQGSIALEIAHLIEELDERVARRTQALAEESERVKILLRITTELTASLDRDRVLNQALQLVNDVVHSGHGTILLLDENSGELMIRAAFGLEQQVPPEGLPSGLQRDEGLAGWVMANREAVVVGNVQEDKRWVDNQPLENRSALAVPLISGDDVIGVMMLTDPRPNLFTDQQLSLVEAAGIQVANAIHNASLYDLIRQQAEKLGLMMREAQVEVAKQQSILQSIADGVLVAQADGTIIMANTPTAHILDMPRNQLIDKSVDELMGLYGESGDDWVKTIEAWAEKPEELEEQTSLKNRLEIEDKIVLVHVGPVFANNRYFGTISIFRDITKEVEVDRMKSEFVSTVSHELRTPMTSIKGYADLMLMGAAGSMSAPQLRYLDVIKKNADRLQLLVNDLLDISRIETGKTQLALQPVDVPQVVSDVVSDHLRGRIQHEEKEIEVSTEIAPSLPLVNADPEKITRVLTNLVDNAFNYTPTGGYIKISARANGDFVFISVRDSGIGISQEDQQKIFDRFFRAENAEVQEVPGTGLGLAIVRSLIEMHGGRLTLESEIGEGSTFTFSLPKVVEESDIL